MPTALIGLGSNLGDRKALLAQALEKLETTPGIASVRVSRLHATKPVGGPTNQEQYLNGAAVLETSLSPEVLLMQLQQIETSLGRRRQERWEARPIDLDLLLYDDAILKLSKLVIPHTSMAFRRFVLKPASEVAPQMVHPTSGWTIEQLCANLAREPSYVAVAGIHQREMDELAHAAAQAVDWQIVQLPNQANDSIFTTPPSSPPAEAIKFLVNRAEELDVSVRAGSNRGVVAVFPLESQWANQISDLPGLFADVWQQLGDCAVRPKLLVIYGAIPSNLRRAGRNDIGPVLWLDSSNPIAAQAEMIAAIQSMS